MAVLEYGNKSEVFYKEIRAESEQGANADPYRIEILTIEEEEGGFSTIALNLPGAGSCGDSKESSIANAKEAIRAILEMHKDAGDQIPWVDVTADMIVRGEYKVIWIHV